MNEKDFAGMAASHKKIEIEGTDIFHFEKDKIKEAWTIFNMAELLKWLKLRYKSSVYLRFRSLLFSYSYIWVMVTVGVFNLDYYCGICHSDVNFT